MTTVILFQVFSLLNCRSLKDLILTIGLWSNLWIYAGIAVVLVLQAAFIYLPFMNRFFGSAPLGLVSWLEALALTFLILPIVGLEKRRSGGG